MGSWLGMNECKCEVWVYDDVSGWCENANEYGYEDCAMVMVVLKAGGYKFFGNR